MEQRRLKKRLEGHIHVENMKMSKAVNYFKRKNGILVLDKFHVKNISVSSFDKIFHF